MDAIQPLRRRWGRRRFVNRPDDCAGNGEFEQTADDPAGKDLRCQRLHRKRDQVVANIQERDHNSELSAGARTSRCNEAGIKEGEKERHDAVTQDQPREVTAKVCFRPPKCWDFIMDAMHKVPVPDEAKYKDKNPGCDECDEEFFPVHNFFRLRFLLTPNKPGTFVAKSRPAVDLNCSRGLNCSDRPMAGHTKKDSLIDGL